MQNVSKKKGKTWGLMEATKRGNHEKGWPISLRGFMRCGGGRSYLRMKEGRRFFSVVVFRNIKG